MSRADPSYISEQDFIGVWGARAKPCGNLFDYGDFKGIATQRIWTVSDEVDEREAGHYYVHAIASPGMCQAAAYGYVVTGKPWNFDTPSAYWTFDDDAETAIERAKLNAEP